MEECGKAGQELDPLLQGIQRPNPQSKEQKIIIYSKPLCHCMLCYFCRFVSVSFSWLSLPM